MRIPQKGEKIYIPSSLYVYHGEDDIAGGIATISNVDLKEYFGKDHDNYCFISVKEIPGVSYNWRYLEKQQEKLKKAYGKQKAHPDPDYRPEFNDNEADWQY